MKVIVERFAAQPLKDRLRVLRRRCFELVGNPRYSRPGLNDLDRKLGRYLDWRGGFFLEAGANDGFEQSNTYYLERFRNWRGVLIEGIPTLYQRCRRTRPRAQVIHAALVGPEYREPTITMRYGNLMSLVDGALGSAEAEQRHSLNGLGGDPQAQQQYEVPARTLSAILDQLGPLPPIDFCSLDVEGFEAPALAGLDLARHAPRYILVEARFFAEVDAILRPFYEQREQLTYHDYLYELRERRPDKP